MITRIKISANNKEIFAKAWELYNSAFPANERRELDYQLQTMQCEQYLFDAIFDDDVFVGIIGWWNFDDIRYVEHLAISDKIRNGGYGKKVLEAFIAESSKSVLLEVEHPEEEIQHRRIAFYQRLGFVLNEHHYAHPPYVGTDYVSLLIMTHPCSISKDELEAYKQKYFPIIHFKHYV